MHRLVYLCDWLPPDFGAVGQYSVLFATERAERGEHVTLVGLSSRKSSSETVELGAGRLETIRVRAASYDRSRLLRRALWTLRTDLALLWHARGALRRADEILFTGSPPFLVHFVVPLNLLLRKRLTYRITDFHPECLIAELGRAPLPLRWFHRFTILLRRRVHAFEVLGEDQRRRLQEIGIGADRIRLRRDPSPVEVSPGLEPLPIPDELRGRVVLLYSGNFGVAHDHHTFLEGYRLHHRHGSGRVGLWLNATGAKADLLAAALARERLPFHRSALVPLVDLPRLLVTPDAHLITLRDEFVGFVLPSKIYACLESGRPVVYIGSPSSDVDLLARARRTGAGYRQIAVGDGKGVAATLEELAAGAL
ncbi:MAG TPA: hypothetical protein VMV46_03805 [Thermoanaerobaculia bacterium]|nr:hypothetical protein [Thermoanaerobaculia bacterium]